MALTYNDENDIIREYCESKSDRAATAFVRKYQDFVFATALRYMKSSDDAEDAAQEAFMKSLDNLHKFRGDSNIKTWLYRITVNICLNMKRKSALRSFFSINNKDEFNQIPSDQVSPHQKIENEEFEKGFLLVLNGLPKKQRETFALRYFEELSYEEISKMLGTSVGGLKANYYQAVKKLSKILGSKII